VWKRPAGVVGGRTMSLDEIEHDILRPRFTDPRVHFAVVCASVSCPDLRAEPYDGQRLSAQLDDAARTFLSNPGKGMRVNEKARKLQVSSIFGWFADDFAKGGRCGRVAHGLHRCRPWVDRLRLERERGVAVRMTAGPSGGQAARRRKAPCRRGIRTGSRAL
jgi:hypothetical protein